MPQKGRKPLIMWMIKDIRDSIIPMYGIHFTRKSAIQRFTHNGLHDWKDCKIWGWKVIKVKISEYATERTDNKA